MPDPIKAARKLCEDYSEVLNLSKGKSEGRSMLHVVAEKGRADLIQPAMDLDLKSGALLNIRTGKHGWTPLQLAAEKGQDSVVKALLEQDGIDVYARTRDKERTALYLAAAAGKTSTVKMLLNYDKSLVEKADSKGQTALHVAAKKGHIDVVTALIDSGADIKVKIKGGKKRGKSAKELADKGGHKEVSKKL